MDRRKILGAVGGVTLAALSATSAFAQEVTLRMHQFLPPQANVPKLVLDKWAADVMEQSDGRIKVEHYDNDSGFEAFEPKSRPQPSDMALRRPGPRS